MFLTSTGSPSGKKALLPLSGVPTRKLCREYREKTAICCVSVPCHPPRMAAGRRLAAGPFFWIPGASRFSAGAEKPKLSYEPPAWDLWNFICLFSGQNNRKSLEPGGFPVVSPPKGFRRWGPCRRGAAFLGYDYYMAKIRG